MTILSNPQHFVEKANKNVFFFQNTQIINQNSGGKTKVRIYFSSKNKIHLIIFLLKRYDPIASVSEHFNLVSNWIEKQFQELYIHTISRNWELTLLFTDVGKA